MDLATQGAAKMFGDAAIIIRKSVKPVNDLSHYTDEEIEAEYGRRFARAEQLSGQDAEMGRPF